MSQKAMYTAISGIRNNQVQMEVIANNIANSGTMAFKRGPYDFRGIVRVASPGRFKTAWRSGWC